LRAEQTSGKADLPEAASFRLKQLSGLFAWALKNDFADQSAREGGKT
jgi:hypothetical protein